MYFKYPRTPHLPYSESVSSDDIWSDINFEGKEVVVTEKMDGECTTMYHDHIHARSMSSVHHPSRSWVKQLHSTIKNDIPEGIRICGENVFAYHSILYFDLPSYFMCYGIYNSCNMCISWDDTQEICELLGLDTVPVIYRGIYDAKLIKKIWTGKGKYRTFTTSVENPQTIEDFLPTIAEGYVIRVSESFHYDDFQKYVAKYVRKNHVRPNQGHWATKPVINNILIGNEFISNK